jgi:hypothetical protein
VLADGVVVDHHAGSRGAGGTPCLWTLAYASTRIARRHMDTRPRAKLPWQPSPGVGGASRARVNPTNYALVSRTTRGGPTPRRPGLKSPVPAAAARQPWPAVRRLWPCRQRDPWTRA